MLESSDDCIKVLDLEARLVAMNRAGRERLGIADFDAVRGSCWLGLWQGDHRRAAEAAIAEAKAGRPGRFVGTTPGAAGAAIWWDVLVTAICGADGAPERMLAISRDVTAQRRQAEFEEQLVGIVSHDLRNPIAAMLMGAQLLETRLPAGSPAARANERILSSGRRATRLIRDLLDFTQARVSGGIPVERREANLHDICRQAVEEVALSHSERRIELAFDGDGAGRWDADRIAQVVGNLVRNALSYSTPGTVVIVRSLIRAGDAVIEVRNVGAPIPAEVLLTLFQPFKRGERKHDSDRSIGLGLYIVAEIVRGHGGSVAVSSSEAEGTTFRVVLPRG